MSKGPWLDREQIMEQFDGDEELFAEIAELFIEDAPKQMTRIREAVAKGDALALNRAAHALKGSVSNFGVEAVYDLARSMEIMGDESDFQEAEKTCDALGKTLGELLREMRALIRESGK